MDTLQQSPPAEPEGGLRRNLKKRHLLMMSLGGTIGTGLFIGIAEPLSSVGRREPYWPICLPEPLCWRR